MKRALPAVVVVLAVLAELTLGQASGAPDAAFFLGRFHPLVVHLPIGFFLLVAMGEAATLHPKLRDRVEPALGLLLPVSAVAALAAFLMGQLLALEGGFPAQSLSWHRRLTLVAVIGMAACWVVFEWQRARAGRGRGVYRAVMVTTLGVLSLGAHFGGTMTRGEAYLAKYAPGPLKPLLGGEEPKKSPKEPARAVPAGAEPLVYQQVVQPLLDKYCVECHGAEKQKGKLRLDSLEQLMKGGENGAVVVAGDSSKSPLHTRSLLPLSDDDHMPPEDKPQPKPEELGVIQFWIDRGASPTLKVKDALPPTISRGLLEHAAGGAPPPAAVPVAAAPTLAGSSSASVPEATPPAAATAPATAPAPAAEAAPASTAATERASAATAGSDSDSKPAPAPAVALSGPGFLATHCVKCHGPQKQKGKLRVDSVAALLQGGKGGPALVPGSPDKSSIVQRVRLPLENDEHMPPKKEPQPSAAEVAAFVAWVRSSPGTSTAATRPVAAAPDAPSAPASESAPASASAAASESASSPESASASATDSAPATGSGSGSGSATASASSAAVSPPTAPSAAAAGGPPDPALLKSLPPRVVLFSDAIQPLFREKCGKCHIKDSPAGGLGVGQHQQLLEGGYSGPGIVARDRLKSHVMARLVLPPSDDERMPPEGEPQLSPDEVELVGAWIDQGAPAGDPTEVAKLTGGAVRALSALGVKAGPEPLAAQSGGCAACSVPGGVPRPGWLEAQAVSLLLAVGLLMLRRKRVHPSALKVRERTPSAG